MLTSGQVLQHRYEILHQLGTGGMGAVYKAKDLRLSRNVALKESFGKEEELQRAFQREAKLLAHLEHPNLPRVTDHFSEEEVHYLVMDYIEGTDLQTLLEEGQPFSIAEALRWADDLLDAIHYLHCHEPPVVHRDIKPSNIKLNPKGKIFLLDFGLAKGSSGLMTFAGSTQSVFGYSKIYSPLEQIQGEKTNTYSDLYSMAATLYHLLSKHPPIDALTRVTRLVNEGRDPLVRIQDYLPELPDPIATVIMATLSLKATERPLSAAEMRSKLKAVNQTTPSPFQMDTLTRPASTTVVNTEPSELVTKVELQLKTQTPPISLQPPAPLQVRQTSTLANIGGSRLASILFHGVIGLLLGVFLGNLLVGVNAAILLGLVCGVTGLIASYFTLK
jgi:eukaryotic-like serine/threonine-protein kinase